MNFFSHQPRKNTSGFVLPAVIIFGAVFLTIGVGLVNYLLVVERAGQNRVADERALAIAEAGLNYYAWHLSLFPTDIQDGTSGSGPFVHTYTDTHGNTVGTFSLSIDGNIKCGQITSIDITSTGYASSTPWRTKTLTARYSRTSVGSYAMITNAAVKIGTTATLVGRFHSNNGVRMDGTSISSVESAVSTWTCTAAQGCSPDQVVAGVFGSGTNSALWKFPVPSINFSDISTNLSTIQSAAQTGGGLYFGSASGTSGQRGWHIVLRSDGTMSVSMVTATRTDIRSWPANNGTSYVYDYTVIQTEGSPTLYTIPTSCGAIYANDNVWLEGVVKGKVTVATPYNIYLQGNITYAANDGTNGLAAIAASSILATLNSADVMSLHGIFVAQNGVVGRNYYTQTTGYTPPEYWGANGSTRSSLSVVGTMVSPQIPAMSWGSPVSNGYLLRNYTYDGTLANDPPPFTPYTTTSNHFVSWRQE